MEPVISRHSHPRTRTWWFRMLKGALRSVKQFAQDVVHLVIHSPHYVWGGIVGVREGAYHASKQWKRTPKLAKQLGAIAIVGGLIWWAIQPNPEYERIYAQYYEHYYSIYKPQMNEANARYYAHFYADYYADYYASSEYREAAAHALPVPTPENMAYPSNAVNAALTLNAAGLRLIREFEGYSDKPYKDSGGRLTIGFGHLVRKGEFYTNITREQAEALMQQDLKLSEAIVKRHVRVPLQPNQYAALVSLVYNIGEGHFVESTLLRRLNKGDFASVPEEFLRWRHVNGERVNGLERRRKAEVALFEGR